MTDVRETRVVDESWITNYDLGEVKVLVYPTGRVGIEHQCKSVGTDANGVDIRLVCAPKLQIGINGHRVLCVYPITITPSVLCPDCGLHGFVRDGKWIRV